MSFKDYTKLEVALMHGDTYVKVSIGVIGLKDVRAVIEQKPEEKSKKEVVKENPAGTPDVDVMTFEYLKQQEKQVKEWLEANPEYMDDEDSELDGGRFN
jgi:hypothetical protein